MSEGLFCAMCRIQSLHVYFTVLGNKIDRTSSREVPTHIGQEWADRYEMKFIETSAKEADNVDKLFLDIATELTRDARERCHLADSQTTFSVSSNTKTINSCSQCFKF